jgi:hypothetical protein
MEEKIYTHKCVRPVCKNTYESSDPDAYYCSQCEERNKKIQEQVNKNIAATNRKPIEGEFQRYERLRKERGIRGFISARDMLGM